MKVYTYNDKVLTNSANGKWLKEKEAPAGFVMNASNATYTLVNDTYWVSWQSPAYPDGYNGNGKQYILVNNNATMLGSLGQGANLYYGNGIAAGGPPAVNNADIIKLGTNTGVLLNNSAVGAGYGTYFTVPVHGEIDHKLTTLEEVQAYMANVSITIVDP